MTTRCNKWRGTEPFVVRLCLDIVIDVYPSLLQIFGLQEILIPVRHRVCMSVLDIVYLVGVVSYPSQWVCSSVAEAAIEWKNLIVRGTSSC